MKEFQSSGSTIRSSLEGGRSATCMEGYNEQDQTKVRSFMVPPFDLSHFYQNPSPSPTRAVETSYNGLLRTPPSRGRLPYIAIYQRGLRSTASRFIASFTDTPPMIPPPVAGGRLGKKVFATPPAIIITTRHPFTGWPITQPINLNRTDVPLGSHGPFLLLLEPECIGYRGNFVGICCTCMSDWSVCLFYI